jgi:cytochrome c oxidase cbb3-type subunit 2
VKHASLLFTGLFASFAAAWWGLILIPQAQIGELQPQVDEENGDVYPRNVGGVQEQGRKVYLANGCIYCHTQQVREPHMGPDIQREWGIRRTVPRDYIYESPVTLGTIRNGPDLSNTGAPKADDSNRKYVSDPEWLYLHLYNPRSVVEDSIMPSYRFLFEKHKISGQKAEDALALTGADALPSGYEVVPKSEARALVGYLLSLDKSHPLKEVKPTPLVAK